MNVPLSEKAATEIRKIMDDQGMAPETVIRVGVQGGGCSGFSYSLNWDTQTSGRTTSAGGVGLTTAQFAYASNFAGFTFTTTPGGATSGAPTTAAWATPACRQRTDSISAG